MKQNLGVVNWRRMRRMQLVRGVLVATIAAAACSRGESAPRRTASSSGVSKPPSAPVTHVSTARIQRSDLRENSAAAMSRRQAGVFFTINDSGNEPLLFAVDTTGADRGVWRVGNARNIDWEAAAVGPCGATASNGPDCVYIGDVGDNSSQHPSRDIYRVIEPAAAPAHRGTTNRLGMIAPSSVESLRFAYADHPHDVEAMYVAPNGDVFLITKRAIGDARGRLRPALLFRVPSSAWGARVITVAALVDSLPIVPGSEPFRLITDASLAPDAKHLAVRTYAELYIFATDSLTGAIKHGVSPSVCDVTPLGEYQGEGVTWTNAGGRFVFTSEGRREPLRLADCAVP